MTPGTVAAILAIRKVVAETDEASAGECLAGIAHELGFLIAFLTDTGEDAEAIASLVATAANTGAEAYAEAKEADAAPKEPSPDAN